MKFIFAVFVSIACIIGSVWLTSKYKFRKCFYNDFLTFNKILEREVRFGQKSICSLLDETVVNTDFYVAIKSKVFNGKAVLEKVYLSDDEIMYFNEYVRNIGVSDRGSQIEYLSGITGQVNDKLKICQEEYIKYTSLYIKMGILIGLLGFIIII